MNAYRLANEVLVFFAINYDEELTAGDIAERYSVALSTVDRRLAHLCQLGYLETRRTGEISIKDGTVYSAGPALRDGRRH